MRLILFLNDIDLTLTGFHWNELPARTGADISTLSWRGADVGRLSCPQFSHPVGGRIGVDPSHPSMQIITHPKPRAGCLRVGRAVRNLPVEPMPLQPKQQDDKGVGEPPRSVAGARRAPQVAYSRRVQE